MTEEPINITTRKPHKAGSASCGNCGKKWVAVSPEKVETLQCPRCLRMAGFFEGDLPYILATVSSLQTEAATLRAKLADSEAARDFNARSAVELSEENARLRLTISGKTFYCDACQEMAAKLAEAESLAATFNEIAKANAERARMGDELLTQARAEIEKWRKDYISIVDQGAEIEKRQAELLTEARAEAESLAKLVNTAIDERDHYLQKAERAEAALREILATYESEGSAGILIVSIGKTARAYCTPHTDTEGNQRMSPDEPGQKVIARIASVREKQAQNVAAMLRQAAKDAEEGRFVGASLFLHNTDGTVTLRHDTTLTTTEQIGRLWRCAIDLEICSREDDQ